MSPILNHPDGIRCDAAEFAEVLSTAKKGDTIAVGPGTIKAPIGGFQVPSNIKIIGAWPGRNRITCGTIIEPASPNDHGFVLCANESDPPGNVRLEHLIVRASPQPGTGCGFIIDRPASLPGQIPAHVEFVRCQTWGVGQDGFFVRHGNRGIDAVILDHCSCANSGRHGIYIEQGTWPRLYGCLPAANRGAGVYLMGVEQGLLEDVYTDANAGPQIVINGGMWNKVVRGCCEAFVGPGRAGVGVLLKSGREQRIDGMTFLSGAPPSRPAGISILGENTLSPAIGRCGHRNVPEPVTRGLPPGSVATQDAIIY